MDFLTFIRAAAGIANAVRLISENSGQWGSSISPEAKRLLDKDFYEKNGPFYHGGNAQERYDWARRKAQEDWKRYEEEPKTYEGKVHRRMEETFNKKERNPYDDLKYYVGNVPSPFPLLAAPAGSHTRILHDFLRAKDDISSLDYAIMALLPEPTFDQRIDPKYIMNESSKAFVRNALIEIFPDIQDGLHKIVQSCAGYTSCSGFIYDRRFVKIDLASRLSHEVRFMRTKLDVFDNFKVNGDSVTYVGEDANENGLAIVAMDDLQRYPFAGEKLFEKYFKLIRKLNLIDKVDLHLLMMAIFHSETLKLRDGYQQVIYCRLDGTPHYEDNPNPFNPSNKEGYGKERFESTKIDANSVKPIVKAYLDLRTQEENAVIHGDWKQDNFINGYLVDYAMVGRAFEIDEYAYFLSDMTMGCGLEEFRMYAKKGIKIRKRLDEEFGRWSSRAYRKLLVDNIDAAFLTWLVLRYSVMDKRDMTVDSKYNERRHYQQMIAKVLEQGDFTHLTHVSCF